MIVRIERPADIQAIRALITGAFYGVPYSHGREADIVDALRRDDNLVMSWVAEIDGRIAGHAAFSPVTIDGQDVGWFGLGPVAVAAACRGKGVASTLIETGLKHLKANGANGCVVFGEPKFYSRFGFEPDARLKLERAPSRYFQRLLFAGDPPAGHVEYAAAFRQT